MKINFHGMETFFHAGEICFLCNQSCDELDEENQEHHRDG